MYTFSTCWNSHRHTDGRAMLREIRDLGFEYAELSHGTRVALVPGIIEAVEAKEIKISTLHNFCPLPMGVNHAAPNLYQFSADRERERELAERYTIKTLEFAGRIQAPLVVLHSGSIDMKQYTDKLIDMVDGNGKSTPRYQKIAAEALKKAEAKKERYFHRTKESLKKLAAEAEKRGITLGVENRQALEELPLDSDFLLLFREVNSPALRYWHDTGHAQIKENLGYINHHIQLESLRDRLAGFHIHDVKGAGRDHCAPGTGGVNFGALAPLARTEHIKVFEFSPSLTAPEAQAGVAHVKGFWGGE
jgi:sugar phosphate isomerase/epimerase